MSVYAIIAPKSGIVNAFIKIGGYAEIVNNNQKRSHKVDEYLRQFGVELSAAAPVEIVLGGGKRHNERSHRPCLQAQE